MQRQMNFGKHNHPLLAEAINWYHFFAGLAHIGRKMTTWQEIARLFG